MHNHNKNNYRKISNEEIVRGGLIQSPSPTLGNALQRMATFFTPTLTSKTTSAPVAAHLPPVTKEHHSLWSLCMSIPHISAYILYKLRIFCIGKMKEEREGRTATFDLSAQAKQDSRFDPLGICQPAKANSFIHLGGRLP